MSTAIRIRLALYLAIAASYIALDAIEDALDTLDLRTRAMRLAAIHGVDDGSSLGEADDYAGTRSGTTADGG